MQTDNKGIQYDVRNLQGEVVDSIYLSSCVFDVPVNRQLFSQYMRYCLLLQSSGTANTKNRSDVAGSGKKRRRQKKSGKARMGEIAGHHRGGPVAHGPRVVNKDELRANKATIRGFMNKKQKKNVLAMILSQKLSEGNLVIVDKFTAVEPKTKLFGEVIKVFGITPRGGVVLVDSTRNIQEAREAYLGIGDNQNALNFHLSIRNCYFVRPATTFTFTVHSLMKYEKLFMTKDCLEELMQRFGINEKEVICE